MELKTLIFCNVILQAALVPYNILSTPLHMQYQAYAYLPFQILVIVFVNILLHRSSYQIAIYLTVDLINVLHFA
jgi:hypothetical protein